MESSHNISTSELLVIAGKEIGKAIPIVSNIISAHEAIFAAIEMNRIRIVLEEVLSRIAEIERASGKPYNHGPIAAQVLVYGAEQARHDPLVESKAKEYGSAITSYMQRDSGMDEIVEILDALRKLSALDLKILYQFRLSREYFSNRLVAELVGYHPQIHPIGKEAEVRKSMISMYPSFMRLQGLGLLYLSHVSGGGEPIPDIGGLSDELRKFAFLTPVGERLVRVLP